MSKKTDKELTLKGFLGYCLVCGGALVCAIICINMLMTWANEKLAKHWASQPLSHDEVMMNGPHLLRKMAERNDTSSTSSGGFFLFFGSYDSKTETKATAKFAWQMGDGTYAISTLPLEKIRVRFDEAIKTPVIEFAWRNRVLTNTHNPQYLLRNMDYAVVTVRESDWPVWVQLPMNQ